MTTEKIEITLASGAIAHVHTSDGDKTTIQSPEPSPPGSTVRGRIDGVQVEFQLKVRSCRKVGDSFTIDGRTQNATRQMKAALSPSQGNGSPPKPASS